MMCGRQLCSQGTVRHAPVTHALPLLCLQLDNMLLHGPWPRPQLKLCDFGFSKNEVVQSVSKSTCGTPEYMAPEVRTMSPSCRQMVIRCPCAWASRTAACRSSAHLIVVLSV